MQGQFDDNLTCQLAIAAAASLFWFLLGLWRGQVRRGHDARRWASVEAEHHRFLEAMDALSEGVAVLDHAGCYLYWNRRYAEIAFKEVGEIRPGSSFESVVRAGLAKGLYPEAVGREDAWLEERLARQKAGDSLHEQPLAEGRWLRIEERRTREGGTIVIAVDITDLKHAVAAIARARDEAEAANHVKSEFLANMSHEIRTPLNGVIGMLNVLKHTPLEPQQAEMLRVAEASSEMLLRLLSDLLDFSRVERGQVEIRNEAFSLGDLVRQAVALRAPLVERKGLAYRLVVAEDAESRFLGDDVRVGQILGNLIDNAVKFTEAGEVAINVGWEGDGRDFLRFEIRDTGIGFDAHTKARLFSRFEQADASITRRFGGSGLGLAISRGLAELMGGTLEADSEPGVGSTFVLRLPLRRAPCAQAA